MIPAARRVEYALGYIALGLINEASDELEAIGFDDRFAVPVLHARIELHMAAKHWDVVIGFASRLVDIDPGNEHGWISWAYALRELDRVAEALAVLQRGVLIHGEDHAVFHYNLGCYHCLLGNFDAARICLKMAYKMDRLYRTSAKTDPDLCALFGGIKKSTC